MRYAPFATRPRRERTGATLEQERQASIALESALRPALLLERFPKSSIEVYALVLESDGGEESACLVAAALAAADAGIDMLDLPASVRVAGHAAPAPAAAASSSGASSAAAPAVTTIDPDARESAGAAFTMTAALMPRSGLLTHTAHAGEAAPEAFLAALSLAMDGCVSVCDVMRAALCDSARRRLRAAAAAGAGSAAAAATGAGAAAV